MYPGTVLALKMHPRITMTIAMIIACTGLMVSSYVTNFYAFLFFYGIFFGLAYSLSYATPLIVAWSYFDGNKGRVSGIVTAGFGLSSGIFNIITLQLVNPDNLLPDIAINEGSEISYYYSSTIADNSPAMLRWCAFILGCIGVVAIALTPNYKEPPEDKIDPF